MQPSTVVTPGTVWTSWHLHLGTHATSAHDRVLTEVVAPVVAGHPWFFIRYWQGGPHLRLRVGDLDEAGVQKTAATLVARLDVAGRLTAGEEPLDRAYYAADAARMAAAETGRDRVPQELREPGVHRDVYTPEHDRYGGPALMPRTEALFQLSSELVLALVPRLPGRPERRVAALRATVAAAATLGDATEQTYFYARGLQAWQGWAAGHGYTADQIATLSHVPGPAGRGRAPEPADGPFTGWSAALTDLAADQRAHGAGHPGPVVSSHVHMLHNRLGLTLPEELNTYARLAHAFPVTSPTVAG